MKLTHSLMCSTCGIEDHVYSNKQTRHSGGLHSGGVLGIGGGGGDYYMEPTMPRQYAHFGDKFTSIDLEDGVMNPIICSSVLIHRHLLNQAGGFGGSKYGQDLILWRKCLSLVSASDPSSSSTVPTTTTTTSPAAAADNDNDGECLKNSTVAAPSWLSSSTTTHSWYGHSCFIKKLYVIYGTQGVRSSTNKETRQAISMILKESRSSATNTDRSVSSLIQGFVGV
jgi:hypothetical protein